MARTRITRPQLQEERDFLLARAAGANRVTFGDSLRWTGTSSNALVRYIFGGDHPASEEFPRDPSDLAACYRTVYRLPDHLRFTDELGDLLHGYRAAVLARYDLAEMDRVLDQEVRIERELDKEPVATSAAPKAGSGL